MDVLTLRFDFGKWVRSIGRMPASRGRGARFKPRLLLFVYLFHLDWRFSLNCEDKKIKKLPSWEPTF